MTRGVHRNPDSPEERAVNLAPALIALFDPELAVSFAAERESA